MPKSLFYANRCDVGLDLAIIGKIGLGFIEEPFDVFVEGQLLRAFDLQRLLSPFKIPFAVLGGATSLQAGFILERGDNTLRLTLLYAY